MPGSEWNLDFSGAGGVTTVSITIKQMIKMGFQGGFTMTLNYLEQLLTDLKK